MGILALALLYVVAWAPEALGVPLDSEFLINSTTTGIQRTTFDSMPAVAVDDSGNFVVVWTSEGQDSGVTQGVYGQRYNASGVPQGGEFLVNSTVAGDQLEPAVAMDAAGNFVVSWTGLDAAGMGIFFQRFNAAGTPQGGETRANTYTTNDQKWSSTAMDAVGNFVVVWASEGQDGSRTGVYGQRYNASGVPQGSEMHISTETLYEQDSPVVSMNASGAFVVCWSSWAQDSGNSWGSYAQRFDASGTPQGSEFRTNSTTTSEQWYNRVAIDDSGNFTVVWESRRQDSANNGGVFAQRYNAAGTPQGGEFGVNTNTSDEQWEIAISASGAGDFIIVWGSIGQDGSEGGIYGQRYLANGTPNGGEFHISTTTNGMQERPAVAMVSDEEFVVVWSGNGTGDDAGIFGQRFGPSGHEISGIVFEDIVGDVLADGVIGDASNPGSVGVDVFLYLDGGNNILDATDVLEAGPLATSASGEYAFSGLANGTYFVRVDSRTVPSAQDPSEPIGNLWAVQTYGPANAPCANGGGSATEQATAGPCYGGVTSLFSDSASLPIHTARAIVNDAEITGVDFGFSFNVVVSYRGGDATDDDPVANRTVQGTLRQFLQNASAIDGPNTMRFVPVEPMNDGAWWELAVSVPLPVLADDETAVDGTAYELADGSTIRDTNVSGPEFEIDGSGALAADGLTILSEQNEVRSMTINGFSGANQAGIRVDGAAANTNRVAGCTIGLSADGATANANYHGIVVTGPSNTIGGAGVADRNIISGNTANGVFLDTDVADGNVIAGNYFGIGPNGIVPFLNSTGIMVSGGINNTIGGSTTGERNVIAGSTSYGIYLIGAGTQGNAVKGNYIGVNATGSAGIGSVIGVYVSTGAQSNVIGGTAPGEGNVISSNDQGVTLSGANTDLNLVLGNLIGTDATGTAAVANGVGVRIVGGADNNRVGGGTVQERNVISGNASHGVIIDGNGTVTTGNTIVGNFIGTDVNGTDPLGNGDSGIRLFDQAQNNTIGGTAAALRNVISGNEDGVFLQGPGTTGNIIQGNYIGTDAAGTGDLGNNDRGVQIESGADNNTVGGSALGAGNVISGNDNGGLVIGDGSDPGLGATGNKVLGNYIGTDYTGTTPLGNEHHGVQITVVDGNSIGGINDGEGNIVANNTWTGVLIQNNEATGNEILRNSIFSNGARGIDLGDDDVTENNGTKNPSLANSDMDFPVFTTAQLGGTTLTVAGYVGTAPGQSLFADSRVEVFENDGDSSGYGEGLTYLGFLTADAGGNFSGTIDVTGLGLAVGEEISGTATDAGGNTSEFAANVVVAAAPSREISGLVFEDADFAGTATGYDSGVGDRALANVDVELYGGGDAYLTSAITAGDGSFSFTGLSDGTFKVRVRSATIGDADTPPANGLHPTVPVTWPYPLADMSWGHGSVLVGGQDPSVDDTSTGDNAGPGDTWVTVTISGSDVSAVNLGFSFDLVVNADDDLNPDNVRSKQGCLRQFIKNSNAIMGVNKSWFQIP